MRNNVLLTLIFVVFIGCLFVLASPGVLSEKYANNSYNYYEYPEDSYSSDYEESSYYYGSYYESYYNTYYNYDSYNYEYKYYALYHVLSYLSEHFPVFNAIFEVFF